MRTCCVRMCQSVICVTQPTQLEWDGLALHVRCWSSCRSKSKFKVEPALGPECLCMSNVRNLCSSKHTQTNTPTPAPTHCALCADLSTALPSPHCTGIHIHKYIHLHHHTMLFVLTSVRLPPLPLLHLTPLLSCHPWKDFKRTSGI